MRPGGGIASTGDFRWSLQRSSPVTAFPPNGYGLYDMIGDDEAVQEKALQGGCVAYLRKPFLAQALIGAINRAVAA